MNPKSLCLFISHDPCSFARATASPVKITSCTASSEFSSGKFSGLYPCRNAYDGNMADGWATNGQGKGSWIKLQLGGAQTITAMNFANRGGTNALSKGLKLEFSDGSAWFTSCVSIHELPCPSLGAQCSGHCQFADSRKPRFRVVVSCTQARKWCLCSRTTPASGLCWLP